MGDFYESPEQMAKASPEELKELAALIKREQTGGKCYDARNGRKPPAAGI